MQTKYSLYKGKVNLVFDHYHHKYFVDREVTPSVTTILSIIAKPALINWAANMAADYVESHLQAGVSLDEIQIGELVKGARSAHRTKKDKAADVGSLVHKYVEDYIGWTQVLLGTGVQGKKPGLPVNEVLARSVAQFHEWEKEHKVKFLLSEQPVYSKEFKYAGTLDFICKIGGKLYCGDLKTSSGIYPEYKAQLAAYRQARQEEFPSEKYAGNLIVRVSRDGEFEYCLMEGDNQEHLDVFLNALGLSRSLGLIT
jgi:hypothetical protein